MNGAPSDQRHLTTPGEAAPLNGVTFSVAERKDDADIRRLLRENPSQGDPSLSFQREPDYFESVSIDGDQHQAIIARDQGGKLIGMGARATRQAWLNGELSTTGFLSHLRLDHSARGRFAVIRAGYRLIQELHETDHSAHLYMTSIVEGNAPARRLLETGIPGLPSYKLLDRFGTLLPSSVRAPRLPGVHIRAGTPADIAAIADLLNAQSQRFQFAPAWTADSLTSTRCRGLSPTDFSIAEKSGRVVGCVAKWDQRGFRQHIVASYSRALHQVRPLANLLAPLLSTPRLPAVGTPLPLQFLSHVAIEKDDPDLFLSLLAAVHSRARQAGCSLVTGFASRHPLARVLASLRGHRISSRLYAVHWPDGANAAASLDTRPVHAEVALL